MFPCSTAVNTPATLILDRFAGQPDDEVCIPSDFVDAAASDASATVHAVHLVLHPYGSCGRSLFEGDIDLDAVSKTGTLFTAGERPFQGCTASLREDAIVCSLRMVVRSAGAKRFRPGQRTVNHIKPPIMRPCLQKTTTTAIAASTDAHTPTLPFTFAFALEDVGGGTRPATDAVVTLGAAEAALRKYANAVVACARAQPGSPDFAAAAAEFVGDDGDEARVGFVLFHRFVVPTLGRSDGDHARRAERAAWKQCARGYATTVGREPASAALRDAIVGREAFAAAGMVPFSGVVPGSEDVCTADFVPEFRCSFEFAMELLARRRCWLHGGFAYVDAAQGWTIACDIVGDRLCDLVPRAFAVLGPPDPKTLVAANEELLATLADDVAAWLRGAADDARRAMACGAAVVIGAGHSADALLRGPACAALAVHVMRRDGKLKFDPAKQLLAAAIDAGYRDEAAVDFVYGMQSPLQQKRAPRQYVKGLLSCLRYRERTGHASLSCKAIMSQRHGDGRSLCPFVGDRTGVDSALIAQGLSQTDVEDILRRADVRDACATHFAHITSMVGISATLPDNAWQGPHVFMANAYGSPPTSTENEIGEVKRHN